VHGSHASFCRNIATDPQVRLRLRGEWREGTAVVMPMDDEIRRRFSAYARTGPRTMGIDPKLVRVDLD
jgi:F420H(2)-dependent quinone reductase